MRLAAETNVFIDILPAKLQPQASKYSLYLLILFTLVIHISIPY
jgi:hypothetical protein